MNSPGEFQKFGSLSPSGRYLHIQGNPAKKSLLENVAETVGSAQRASWLISFGAVYVNHKRSVQTDIPIGPQDIIRMHLEPKRYAINPVQIQKAVVFENADFMVVDKPSGLPMHPTLDNLHENLISAFDFKTFVTHRLDVPTSGLVVVAKTKEYQSLFNSLLAQRGLTKIYQAFVMNPQGPRLLRHLMKVSTKAPKEIFNEEDVSEPERGAYDQCLLEILSCVGHKQGYVLGIKLLTGRTHQIRAQLSHVGSPIVGDELYGGVPSQDFGLNESEIHFYCPKYLKTFNFTRHRIF